MSCDVGKATKGLENELWRRWSDEKVGEWAFSYVTGSSFTSYGEPPMHIYVRYKFSQNIVADTDKHKAPIDCHKCSSSFLSIVKSNPIKIPASVLEKVRSGSCLKLFLIDCTSSCDATDIIMELIDSDISFCASAVHEWICGPPEVRKIKPDGSSLRKQPLLCQQ